MDMDKLFRNVFNNIVIRYKIFNLIRENNKNDKHLVFRNYNKCNIKWCVRNKQFNLLVYKLSKELNKRNEFTRNYFHFFLEHNTELELLKQIFQLFPNLIPTTINEQYKTIEKCSLCNSTKLPLIYGSISAIDIYSCKSKNKREVIQYLMDELKIKPTKQTLNNLSVDGENITMIKSMFNQGHFSISEDCDIGLLYCSLKAKDLSFYKLILENNPTLKNEFQRMDNHILNQLLVSTGNVEFYKYSFDELLKDEDNIRKIKFYLFQDPILYHINSTAIQIGNIEIIEYLCNNFHLYPTSHIQLYSNNIFSSIALRKEEDGIGKGITSLELLKFFIQHPKFNEFNSKNARETFITFLKINKLDCLIYLKQIYGVNIKIDNIIIDQVLSNYNNFKIEIFKWLISYNDGITTKVKCSVYRFNLIMASLSDYPSLPFKSILDFILLDPNCQITDGDIATVITNYTFSTDIHKYEYICSFIKNDYLKPSFTY